VLHETIEGADRAASTTDHSIAKIASVTESPDGSYAPLSISPEKYSIGV
jgi:hypothetical protein